MTSDQLAHLAEQADFAAGFFKPTHPSVAGRFADCAEAARRMAKDLERKEQLNRIRADLTDIAARINRRSSLDSHEQANCVPQSSWDLGT